MTISDLLENKVRSVPPYCSLIRMDNTAEPAHFIAWILRFGKYLHSAGFGFKLKPVVISPHLKICLGIYIKSGFPCAQMGKK